MAKKDDMLVQAGVTIVRLEHELADQILKLGHARCLLHQLTGMPYDIIDGAIARYMRCDSDGTT